MRNTKPETCRLEHVNLTVSDVQKTSQMLRALFDWELRWQGPSLGGGETAHVGTEGQYLALYRPPDIKTEGAPRYTHRGCLNHICVVVEDLEAAEARVRAYGLEPFNHSDYEPGRRFYFLDQDQIEYEVVSYG